MAHLQCMVADGDGAYCTKRATAREVIETPMCVCYRRTAGHHNALSHCPPPISNVRPPLTQGGYLQNRHNPKPGPFRNDLSRASAGARGNRPGKALIFMAKIRK